VSRAKDKKIYGGKRKKQIKERGREGEREEKRRRHQPTLN